MICDGKVKFASIHIAREAADRRPNRMAYRCFECGSYHVGTRIPKIEKLPPRSVQLFCLEDDNAQTAQR